MLAAYRVVRGVNKPVLNDESHRLLACVVRFVARLFFTFNFVAQYISVHAVYAVLANLLLYIEKSRHA